MGYYDSVKDSVKEDERGANSAKGGNFDTLKENAEKNTKPEEEKGDDTPIEVVEEGGIKKDTQDNQERKHSTGEESNSSEENPFTSSEGSTDTSSIESKLDKLIEQNNKMIEILESFGN
jgi:hypothetical protein